MAELLGRDNSVGFQYYGKRLTKTRKILHTSLNANAVASTWDDLLDQQSMQLMQGFFVRPDKFYFTVHQNIEDWIFKFAYGQEPSAQHAQLATTIKEETREMLQPGRWIVNRIPLLMYVPAWLPGAGFHRWAFSAKQLFLRVSEDPFLEVKQKLIRGSAKQSFVRHALENLPTGSTALDEELIMYAASSVCTAGTESLIASVLKFMLYMTHHPEMQERAFEEIRNAVGHDALPTIRDRDKLRYIDCIIQEVHRMDPVVPLVPHSNTTETEYSGYRIPKKSWVMANVWAMLHDEEEYPDGNRFSPERFLSPNAHATPRDPRTLVYGFGRRACPGSHFANSLFYLIVARMLTLFTISPVVENGRPHLPTLEFNVGLVQYVYIVRPPCIYT